MDKEGRVTPIRKSAKRAEWLIIKDTVQNDWHQRQKLKQRRKNRHESAH